MEYGYKVTTKGREILAACMALGTPLELTKVLIGSGRITEDTNPADVHELLHYVTTGYIGDRHHEENRLYLEVQYQNDKDHADVDAFMLGEFMVYATNPSTGKEEDFLYATLGDYVQSIPPYTVDFPVGIWKFHLTLVVSDEIKVNISIPSGLVTYDDLENAVKNAIKSQMPWQYKVIATRVRDPDRPTYGEGGGGDNGGNVVLKMGPYTGQTEVGVVVSGTLYDAKNMSTNGSTAPDGTILIKTEE